MGAHFGQLVMQDAVRKAIWDADLHPKLLSNTLALGKPIEEVVATGSWWLVGCWTSVLKSWSS